MPKLFEPQSKILPEAQKQIWPYLAPAPRLSFVLYGGTAVALHFGHRSSVDFDFFRSQPLDKKELETSFGFLSKAQTIQEYIRDNLDENGAAIRMRAGGREIRNTCAEPGPMQAL